MSHTERIKLKTIRREKRKLSATSQSPVQTQTEATKPSTSSSRTKINRTVVQPTKNIAKNRLNIIREKLKEDLKNENAQCQLQSNKIRDSIEKTEVKIRKRPSSSQGWRFKRRKLSETSEVFAGSCQTVEDCIVQNSSGHDNKVETKISSPTAINKEKHGTVKKCKKTTPVEITQRSTTCWISRNDICDSMPTHSPANTEEVTPMDVDVTSSSPTEPVKQKVVCVVADTNVFMHFLHKIRDIINFKVSGSQSVIVFIPWMVITELDYIKDNAASGKSEALMAAKFINQKLEEKNSKIVGQTILEVARQKDIGMSPDDKILASCIQASEKFDSVILLSNDVNLRNKALINNIEASAPKDILQKVLFKSKGNVKFLKINQVTAGICTQIIRHCCESAYGDVWNKMDMLQDGPWDLTGCLKRIKKYWRSVFKEKMLKQCYPVMESLHSLLEQNSPILDDSEGFNEYMKKILSFLVFLKDIPQFRDRVCGVIADVIQIAEA